MALQEYPSDSSINKRKPTTTTTTTTDNFNKDNLKPNETTTSSNECRQLSLFTISGFFRIISTPLKYFCKNIIDLIKFTWSLLGFNQPQTDPLTDIANFINKFENKYGQQHPTFYNGSYNQAILEAKKDLKFLIVYLHNNLHEETDEFCKQVLTHLEVVNYIRRNNLLFWACSIDLKEGYLVSKVMRENTYPFLALVALKQNKMIIAKKFQGKTSVEKLLR